MFAVPAAAAALLHPVAFRQRECRFAHNGRNRREPLRMQGGGINGDAGIVESYISYLRRKLDQYSEDSLIQTKRGFGYMLKVSKA